MSAMLLNIMFSCIFLTLNAGNWIAIASIAVVIIITFLGFLGKIIYDQGSLNTGFKMLDVKIDKLDKKFDEFILKPFATSKSPLTLTDKGNEIFNRPKIQEFVKANKNDIISKMKALNYDSAYKAQEKLFTIVDSYKGGNYKINLENEAFETGQNIDIIMRIISIGIRNDVFNQLEMKVEDIDNSDPTKKTE
jgi:hypothetical protein